MEGCTALVVPLVTQLKTCSPLQRLDAKPRSALKPRRSAGTATYHNVRTGETNSITTGESKNENAIPVRSYRSVLNAYVNNPESKFNGPGGHQCRSWTRGILQRMHVA